VDRRWGYKKLDYKQTKALSADLAGFGTPSDFGNCKYYRGD
jgi:hypothetical protein